MLARTWPVCFDPVLCAIAAVDRMIRKPDKDQKYKVRWHWPVLEFAGSFGCCSHPTPLPLSGDRTPR